LPAARTNGGGVRRQSARPGLCDR